MGYIRLLLALSVVLAHTAAPLPVIGRMVSGLVAVECFFVMSGFYMALVLSEKYSSAFPFYWNRFSRIFSGYWVALAFAAGLSLISGTNALQIMASSDLPMDAKTLVVFANLFLFGSDLMFFINPSETGLTLVGSFGDIGIALWPYMIISPAWSLAVELGFYLVAPFVVRSIPKLVALGVASYALKLATLDAFGHVDPWIYRFAPNEFFYFATGALAYKLVPAARKLPAVLGWFCLAVSITVVLFYERVPPRFAEWIFVILAISCPFVLAAFDRLQAQTRRVLWLVHTDRELGEASYMLYLIHVPILELLRLATGQDAASWVVIALSLLLAFPLHQVAKRFDQFLRSRKPRPGGPPDNVSLTPSVIAPSKIETL